MDSKQIEQLLERYWQCETTLEEEARLRDFFCSGDVPPHLARYKVLFAYQRVQQGECLDSGFDARMLAKVGMPVVKARRMTLASRFMPLLKAAAAVALVMAIGGVVQHSFSPEAGGMPTPVDTIGKQISTPSVAALSTEHADERPGNDSLLGPQAGREEPEE